MDFFERNFPLFFGGFFASIPVLALVINACDSSTPEERAEANAQYADSLKAEMSSFSPRDGVECYVLRGYSSTNPRTMSCVTVPH